MTARSEKIQSVKEMDSAYGDAAMPSSILRYHLLMALSTTLCQTKYLCCSGGGGGGGSVKYNYVHRLYNLC